MIDNFAKVCITIVLVIFIGGCWAAIAVGNYEPSGPCECVRK